MTLRTYRAGTGRSRTDFRWEVKTVSSSSGAEGPLVKIIDLELGHYPVESDLEAVIDEISDQLPAAQAAGAWILGNMTPSGRRWREIVLDEADKPPVLRTLPAGRCITEIEAAAIERRDARTRASITPEIRGMVRRGDPLTSQEAAQGILRKASELHAAITTEIARRGPMTDAELEDLERFAHYGYSTVRKRRTELTQAGRLIEVGTRLNRRGARMIVWDLVGRNDFDAPSQAELFSTGARS